MIVGSSARVASLLPVLSALLAGAMFVGAPQAFAQSGPDLLRTDSRTPFVHRLTLYDENGTAIDPSDEPVRPYSPRATCSKCHDYSIISHGLHFNANDPAMAAGRPGEPWIFVDPATGTAAPLSYRAWPGVHPPAALGLTAWQFTLHFGRHLPGGGPGQPDPVALRESKPEHRWSVSGALEIDCLTCHAASGSYDMSEAARQIERQNFRWAPTAAAGLAVVRGEARRLPDNFDPDAPPNPDRPGQQPPKVFYDAARFDADGRVFFDLVRKPPLERCYYCHTNQQVGQDAPPAWHHDGDVHIRAGMQCSDCHRNGIDHNMARGFEGDTAGHELAPALTCVGCHMDTGPSGGRFGAPIPEHYGLPPVHFERLSCTACHSGPWPEMDTPRWLTSMAHSLGTTSRTRGPHQPPAIVAPVFARSETSGKIEPHKQTWPAYWGVKSGEGVSPLPIEVVRKAAKKALPPVAAKEAERDVERAFTDEQILAMLDALAADKSVSGTPVYIRYGRLHEKLDGGLHSSEHAAAVPYRWSLAHDVRPARQALGARGCGDCHSEQGAIYFGRVVVDTPVGVAGPQPLTMVALRGDSERLARSWIFPFENRTAFKFVGFACVMILAATLWVHLAAALRAWLGRIAR